MPRSTFVPWAGLERIARRSNRESHREVRRLERRAHAFYEATLAAFGSSKLVRASQVQATLLNQLSLQVRVISLVSESGYPVQAYGMAATAYELAAAVGFIGTDDDRGREWLEHSSERESYPPSRLRRAAVKDLLTAGLGAPKDLDGRVAAWETFYKNTCMAKHGNPKVLRTAGLNSNSDRLRLFHGPIGGGEYGRIGRLAIFRSAHLLVMATGVFMQARLDQLNRPDARKLVIRFDSVATSLIAAAKTVTKDPATI